MATVNRCPTCGVAGAEPPPEPSIGTWIKDKYGAVSVRTIDSDGNDGWAPAPHGFYAFGRWEAMWAARGPLVECEPWGQDTHTYDDPSDAPENAPQRQL